MLYSLGAMRTTEPYLRCKLILMSWYFRELMALKSHTRVNLASQGPGTSRKGEVYALNKDCIIRDTNARQKHETNVRTIL